MAPAFWVQVKTLVSNFLLEWLKRRLSPKKSTDPHPEVRIRGNNNGIIIQDCKHVVIKINTLPSSSTNQPEQPRRTLHGYPPEDLESALPSPTNKGSSGDSPKALPPASPSVDQQSLPTAQ